MTAREILELINNHQLVVGREYVLDYSDLPLTTIAIADNELDERWHNGNYVVGYDLLNDKPVYMKDTSRSIEAYYDFRTYITGNCKNITMQSKANVKDSNDIIIGENNGTINIIASSNISIGSDNGTIRVENCVNTTIGDANTSVVAVGIINGTIGDYNSLSVANINEVAIGSGNSELTITSGVNIIGDECTEIVIEGSSNEVTRSIDIDIKGDGNVVSKSSYARIGGVATDADGNWIVDATKTSDFNKVEKTYDLLIGEAVGNDALNSKSIGLSRTNNNTLSVVDNINAVNKTSFLEYRKVEGVNATYNKIADLNMRVDAVGRTLILDIEKFYQESSTKSGDTYELDKDGKWVKI